MPPNIPPKIITGMKMAGRAFQVPRATSLRLALGCMGYFLRRAIKYMYIIRLTARRIPGTIPAKKSLAMETLAMTP